MGEKKLLPELETNKNGNPTDLAKNKTKKCAKEDENSNKKSDLKSGKTHKVQAVDATILNSPKKDHVEEDKHLKQKKTGKSKVPKNTNEKELTTDNENNDGFKTPETIKKVGRKSKMIDKGEEDNNISNTKIKQAKYEKEGDNQVCNNTDKMTNSSSESIVSPRMTRLL